MSDRYEVISAEDAEARFNVSDHIAYPFREFASEQEIRLYTGPVAIDGDFTTDPDASWSPFNAIVDGDLTVSGNIDWHDDGRGNFLLVTGNVRARNVLARGCPHIYIGGAATVDNGIQGQRGADGGTLVVAGDVHAKVVVNTLYFTMEIGGAVDAIVLGDPYSTGCPVDFDSEEASAVVVADALSAEGSLDENKVSALLEAGATILRPGVQPAHIAVAERLTKLAEDPDSVVSLDLSESKLRSFPMGVIQFHNLRSLSLSHNPFAQVPPEIGELTALEELTLDSTAIRTLPPEIGALANLRVLDLSETPLESLPDEIGQLTGLRTLRISRVTCPLPDALGTLTGLEELALSYCQPEDEPIDLPAVITRLSGLRSLDLTGTVIHELPEAITELTALEELRLTGSLGAMKTLPDLSALPALHTLAVSGNRLLMTVPFPSHNLLDSVWSVTTLRHLELDRWGEETDYNPETGEHEVVRPNLETLPDAIGNMSELRTVDLSFNGLRTLPLAFYKLENLERVDLRYNPLSPETLDRLAKTFPEVNIDLRNVAARSDEDDPNWQRVHELVKSGAEKLQRDPARATALFEEALSLCTKSARFSDYDQLYALYGLVDIIGRELRGAAPGDRGEQAERLKRYARQALTLVPEDPGDIYHLTDESEFQLEVIRRVGDVLARELMDEADSAEALEGPLSLIECAASCVEEDAHYYVYDTQVRILLKMGRDDEAYRIVERVRSAAPEHKELADIEVTEDYQRWLAAQHPERS